MSPLADEISGEAHVRKRAKRIQIVIAACKELVGEALMVLLQECTGCNDIVGVVRPVAIVTELVI